MLDYAFEAEVIYWRGPAPFLFAKVPDADSAQIARIADKVSYGWGCIPVNAQIGAAAFTTSLFPKDGGYLLPLKVAARKKMDPVDVGDRVSVTVHIKTKAPPV